MRSSSSAGTQTKRAAEQICVLMWSGGLSSRFSMIFPKGARPLVALCVPVLNLSAPVGMLRNHNNEPLPAPNGSRRSCADPSHCPTTTTATRFGRRIHFSSFCCEAPNCSGSCLEVRCQQIALPLVCMLHNALEPVRSWLTNLLLLAF